MPTIATTLATTEASTVPAQARSVTGSAGGAEGADLFLAALADRLAEPVASRVPDKPAGPAAEARADRSGRPRSGASHADAECPACDHPTSIAIPTIQPMQAVAPASILLPAPSAVLPVERPPEAPALPAEVAAATPPPAPDPASAPPPAPSPVPVTIGTMPVPTSAIPTSLSTATAVPPAAATNSAPRAPSSASRAEPQRAAPDAAARKATPAAEAGQTHPKLALVPPAGPTVTVVATAATAVRDPDVHVGAIRGTDRAAPAVKPASGADAPLAQAAPPGRTAAVTASPPTAALPAPVAVAPASDAAGATTNATRDPGGAASIAIPAVASSGTAGPAEAARPPAAPTIQRPEPENLVETAPVLRGDQVVASHREISARVTLDRLGDVEVRVSRGDDGGATVTIAAARGDTHAALAAEPTRLHGLLDAAGVDPAGRILRFESLPQDASDPRGSAAQPDSGTGGDHRSAPNPRDPSTRSTPSATDQSLPDAATISARATGRARSATAIDITA